MENAVKSKLLRSAPIRRRRLYEGIVERIEHLIVSGELAVGERLPSERELTLTFNVGRTAVREALFALNRMGLVSLGNGERAIVSLPTPKVLVTELSGAARNLLASAEGMHQFQSARALFEVALARHAARHATSADLDRLEQALADNRRALGDPGEFVDSDVAFHYLLAEIPGNPIYTALHAGIVAWLKDQRTTSVGEPGSPEAACKAHLRIYRAIKARDADAAERAMQGHLDEVSRFYWASRERRP